MFLGILGNLSALRTLDLSYNELTDISEKNVFVMPRTLKHLYISHNQIATLPIENVFNLQTLDVSHNQLEYYTEITKMVKNGSLVFYAGKETD